MSMQLKVAVVALGLAVGAAGCTVGVKRPYRAESFGKDKRFAVVTILADPQIRLLGQSKSTVGMLKSMSSSKYEGSSAEILEGTKPRILEALGATGRFQLVPEAQVLSSPAYSEVEEPKLTVVPAKGYKAVVGDASASVARALGVDGALALTVSYGYEMHGANLMGIVSAGKIHAKVELSIDAVAPSGTTIWRETVEGVSKDGIAAVGEAVEVEKLEPLLHQASDAALRALVAGLPKLR